MDRIYRRQRHVYDFTRKYYLLGRDDLIDGLRPPPGGKVLEIGCGTGRNLIRAARAYPDADLYGIDISQEMLATARQAILRQGLTAHIQLAHADATRFDSVLLFDVRHYARIFLSYSLSMIPAWPVVIDRALAHLAPDGELHIVDFGGQEGLPRWLKASLRWWLAEFHVTPRDHLEAELVRRARVVEIERPCLDYAQRLVCRRA
jgi:S-adenosylmethionine-diacylgycerolhomoserine-N-methlytransferase